MSAEGWVISICVIFIGIIKFFVWYGERKMVKCPNCDGAGKVTPPQEDS